MSVIYSKEQLEQIKNNPELMQPFLEGRIWELETENKRLREALEKIADIDYRGNRSSESVTAFIVLKDLGYRK